jgi:hypothetical protein
VIALERAQVVAPAQLRQKARAVLAGLAERLA